MKTISFAASKGGIGKTTTAVSLAAEYSNRGKRVLLIDFDSQGHASLFVGMRGTMKFSPAFRLLHDECTIEEAAAPTPFGFDLISGNFFTASADYHLAATRTTDVLKRALAATPEDRWDLVLVDCPPALGSLTLAAIEASSDIIVPLPLQALPLDGVGRLMDFVARMRAAGHGAEVSAILGTMSDPKTRLARAVKEELERSCPGLLLKNRIGRDIALAEAPGESKPITVYQPKSKGARDYALVADELTARGIA
jgi:chromosome partitioning protein